MTDKTEKKEDSVVQFSPLRTFQFASSISEKSSSVKKEDVIQINYFNIAATQRSLSQEEIMWNRVYKNPKNQDIEQTKKNNEEFKANIKEGVFFENISEIKTFKDVDVKSCEKRRNEAILLMLKDKKKRLEFKITFVKRKEWDIKNNRVFLTKIPKMIFYHTYNCVEKVFYIKNAISGKYNVLPRDFVLMNGENILLNSDRVDIQDNEMKLLLDRSLRLYPRFGKRFILAEFFRLGCFKISPSPDFTVLTNFFQNSFPNAGCEKLVIRSMNYLEKLTFSVHFVRGMVKCNFFPGCNNCEKCCNLRQYFYKEDGTLEKQFRIKIVSECEKKTVFFDENFVIGEIKDLTGVVLKASDDDEIKKTNLMTDEEKLIFHSEISFDHLRRIKNGAKVKKLLEKDSTIFIETNFLDVPQILKIKLIIDVICECCGKKQVGESFKKCARCKKAKYCSRQCQKKDWMSFHKFKCVQD